MYRLFSSVWFVLPLFQVLLVIGFFCEKSVVSASQPARGATAELPSPSKKLSRRQAPSLQLAQSQPSLELKLLLSGTVPLNAVTSRNPSPISMTLPSLWWVSEQISTFEKYGPQLIEEWIAYPIQSGQAGRVDLLVNRQLWSLLDYLQRYELVSRFSAIARSYGYNTRVYDNPDRLPVATYTCRFAPEDIRLLQEATTNVVSKALMEEYVGREDMADRTRCQLNLDPVNRPGKFNPVNGL